ncbi:MAG: AAA family ATPase [Candidatus Zixiibacteriota bacterium]
MAERLFVLVIDSDNSNRELLKKNLDQIEDVELASEVKSLDESSKAVRETTPDIVILELTKDSRKTLEWIQRTKLEFPEINIFVASDEKTSELIISEMRAGAQEFLSRPIDAKELKEAIHKVFKIKEQLKAHTPESGRIISVFSKKGGLGVTTIAVNLGIALSQVTKKKATLIDLDLQLGDVTNFLNLSPEYNILDACNPNDEVDGVKLQSCMTRHKSGIFVLAEPKNPLHSNNISSSQINQILGHLQSMFSYVIVDTPHMLDSKTLEAFELSDHILVVTVPNIPSVRATKKTLAALRDMGYGPDKVKVIVNRTSKRDKITTDEISKALHYPVSWNIPNNYKDAIESVDSGVPLVHNKGGSNVAKSILGLAEDITKWRRSAFIMEVEKGD